MFSRITRYKLLIYNLNVKVGFPILSMDIRNTEKKVQQLHAAVLGEKLFNDCSVPSNHGCLNWLCADPYDNRRNSDAMHTSLKFCHPPKSIVGSLTPLDRVTACL